MVNPFVQSVLKFMFSHLGLALIVLGYSFIGSLIFGAIEWETWTHAVQARNASQELEDRRGDMIEAIVNGSAVSDSQFNKASIDTLLDDYHQGIKDYLDNYYGITVVSQDVALKQLIDPSSGPYGIWTITSGFLFCVTILTTIGYGHFTPTSEPGRFAVILYGVIGVPLMLMFLTNVGELLLHMMRTLYAKVLCRACIRRRKEKEARQQEMEMSQKTSTTEGGWDLANEDVYTTANFVEPAVRPIETASISQSKRMASITYNEDIRRLQQAVNEINDELKNNSAVSQKAEEHEHVPFVFIAGILVLYIVIGGIAFSYWDDWPLITGIYYSFVSVFTIGFGDYVLGMASQNTQMGQVKTAVAYFYIVFGLSLVSMTLSLVAENVHEKSRRMAEKVKRQFLDKRKNAIAAKRASRPTIVVSGDPNEGMPARYPVVRTSSQSKTYPGTTFY